MINQLQYEISIDSREPNEFFLSATFIDRETRKVPVDDWKRILFCWHKASFYGTNLTTLKEAVLLSAWETLEFFSESNKNALVTFHWCPRVSWLWQWAPTIYKEIQSGHFSPDFEQWQKGKFGWKLSLPDTSFEEETTLFDYPFIKTWVSNAISEFIQNDEALRTIWDEITVHYPLITAKHGGESGVFLNEESWLERIGWQLDPTPFTVELRLNEPEADPSELMGETNGFVSDTDYQLPKPANDWSLDIILRDKQDANFWVTWGDADATQPIPADWLNHLDRVERNKQFWLELVPWLKADQTNATNFELESIISATEPSLYHENQTIDFRPEKRAAINSEEQVHMADTVKMINSLTEAQAWTFLTESSILLAEAGVEILLPSWWQEIKALNPKLKIQLRSSVGSSQQSVLGLQAIGDFDWKLATGNAEVDENEFLQMVEQNRRLIKINGKWMKLDPAFVKQVKEMMTKVKKEGLSFQDILAQEWLKAEEMATDHEGQLDNPLSQVQIELNKHLEKLLFHLHNLTSIPQIHVPEGLHGELRPYQKQGVEWLLFLRKFGFGACLADDMGLGKTVQMITYFLYVKNHEKLNSPALIICPTSVLGNWQKELEKFAPTLSVYLHYGSNRQKGDAFAKAIQNYDIILTSYGLAQIDEKDLQTITWSTICLDEAQNIKNTFTKQSKAIRGFKGTHHIALTGTPIENRLTELWSIFDYMNKGYLGSLNSFTKRYVAPIEKNKDEKKIKQVQQLVKPFLLRRTKKDESVSLNLPDKQEQKEYIPLTVEQASLYEQLVQDTFARLEKLSGMERRGLILSMLLKLKQICNHPALYLKDDFSNKPFVERSHKTEKLLELVDNIRDRNESCLIFTQYIGMGKMLQTLINDRFGETVHFLQGSLRKQERDKIIDSFQNGEQKILILSLKAGGIGLNLTAANHVIHYDRWWNPAVENQATDRAYRIGQKRFVHVHKLITTGTLEEKIDEMLEKKKSLSDEIISGENWITELSTDDLRELFTLRQDWSD